jgi:hypothetical protein
MDTAAIMPICADPALAPGTFVAAFMIAPASRSPSKHAASDGYRLAIFRRRRAAPSWHI